MGNVYYMISQAAPEEEVRDLRRNGSEMLLLMSDPDSYQPWVNVVVDTGEGNSFVFLPNCFVSGEDYEDEEYEC